MLLIKRLKRVLYFQTGIGAAVCVTLDTEQLISHTCTVLVNTIASLQGSDGEIIPVSEVHQITYQDS